MDSSKENNTNDKNSIIDVLAKELKKRKKIKEQSKIIRCRIDDNKQEHIQSIEEQYKSRSKKIDKYSIQISDAVNSGNIDELEDAFKKLLDDMNN